MLEKQEGSNPQRKQMEVSRDTHAVTLGTRGTAGTLGSRGTTGTGEARSASNARSTLEEAEEVVRELHRPSSQSRAGARDTHNCALGTRLTISTRISLRRERGRGGLCQGWQDMRPKDKEPYDATYSRTSSASRAGGTGLTTSTLWTFAATSSLGTGFTLGRKRREEEP